MAIPVYSLRYTKKGELDGPDKIRCAQDAAEFLRQTFSDLDPAQEHYAAIFLNMYNKPVGVHVEFNPQPPDMIKCHELFKAAILANASFLIVGHNHLDSSLTLSDVEKRISDRISFSGELFGIKLLDFIIVNQEAMYYSSTEDGTLGTSVIEMEEENKHSIKDKMANAQVTIKQHPNLPTRPKGKEER